MSWPRRALAALALLATACGAPEAGPRASVILAADPAPKLSDYGFFLDPAARKPAARVVAYDLINALFADQAAKHRYVFVPKGQAAKYDPEDVFDLPVGSVLIKTFAFAPDMRTPNVDERYVETRLLIHKADGWAAYPYIWNLQQTEAEYVAVGGRQRIDFIDDAGAALAINYGVPNRNQCKECHAIGHALMPIGPKARNLNHVGPLGVNQISDWTARGMLFGAPAADQAPAVPAVFGDAALDERARAWLDINCAHCHKANGGASNSGLYLGWRESDPRGWGVRKRPTAAGRASGDNFYVIEPGAPDKSILIHRITSTEPGVLMPELGRTIADARGVKLISDWIAAMPPIGEAN